MQLTPRWPQHWGSFSDELEGRVSLSDIGVVVVMVEMVVERGRKQEEDGGRTCNRQSRESGPTKRSGPPVPLDIYSPTPSLATHPFRQFDHLTYATRRECV